MSHNMAPADMETGAGSSKPVDDDGRPRRTGTAWTASAHIITTVLGSGVLSLAWGVAQLGWVAGPGVMTLFAAVIYYTSALLADCYRTGNPVSSPRNRTYMAAVRATLGGSMVKLCGAVQFINLVRFGIGITIAASVSMMAIKEAGCFHRKGHKANCRSSSKSLYIAIYGIMEIFLSQIPGLESVWWLSMLATVMSCTYSIIGISLCVAQSVANGGIQGGLTGVAVGINAAGKSVTVMDKVWRSLQAFGNMAFAYAFSIVLLEIQVEGGAAVRGEGDEEGDGGECGGDNGDLPAVRMRGVRGVRQHGAGQHPHGLRLLRALLAAGPGQRRGRRPPGRHVPGHHPAHLCLRRAAGRRGLAGQRLRRHDACPAVALGRPRGRVPAPADRAHGVRVPDHRRGHGDALLRVRGGAHRRRLLLAAHRLLPGVDVHRAAAGAAGQDAVAAPPGAQRRLPARLRRGSRRLHRRRRGRVPPEVG
uniref:Amino acid transporter transmembrane domain-containing protein n=1 Tax=Aegilops tauschii subsp. strangulata TaxID=200361 RepID=A0A453CA67_AEGTS